MADTDQATSDNAAANSLMKAFKVTKAQAGQDDKQSQMDAMKRRMAQAPQDPSGS